MSLQESEKSVFSGNVTERTLQKWKIIQTASILPLILSVVFLLRFKGSIPGVIVFFLIFIVGIILPQVYRDFIRLHLSVKDDLEHVKNQLNALNASKETKGE